MKFLDQILRRKPTVKSPKTTVAVAVDSVDGLGPEALVTVVLAKTGKSPDIELRISALKKLPYSKFICDLAFAMEAPAALQWAAKQHLAKLIDSQEITEALLAHDINDPSNLLDIAGYSNNEDFQKNAIANIEDKKKLLQICLSTHSAGVRKIIVETLDDRDSLRELSNTLKTRDKVAYRIAKSKLDKFRAEENEAKALQDSIQRICADAEEHCKRSFDKDYLPRLSRLEARWEEVADAATSVCRNRYTSAIKICREVLEEKAAEVAEMEAFAKARAEAPQQRKAVWEKIRQLLIDLAQMDTFSDADAESIRAALEDSRKAWQKFADYSNPSETEAKDYTRTCDAVEELVRLFLSRGTIAELRQRIATQKDTEAEPETAKSPAADNDQPAEYDPGDAMAVADDSADQRPQNSSNIEVEVKYLRELLRPVLILPKEILPEKVNSAVEFVDLRERDRKEKAEKQKKARQSIVNLIRKSQSSLAQGRLRQAIGIRHSIEERIPALEEIPENIAAQLGELDKAIDDMVDWQAYAVIPKKEALIDAMHQLIGTDMVPDVLAGKIKKLQAEWGSLSQSGKDRHEDLWQKFNDAAHIAYEPCRKYFAELAEQRQENLEKRKALVAQLEGYYQNQDWEIPDWKCVEKILHSARKELYSYSPVDRNESEPVKIAFDKVMSSIQEKLEAEYSANRFRKEQLIEQARNLVDITDIPIAIARAKDLQTSWKSIGHCSHKDNQHLWKIFRKSCDLVFEKRAIVEAEISQQKQDCLDQANNIIDEIGSLAKLQGQDILDARPDVERLQETYKLLDDLPATKQNSIHKKYRTTVDNFHENVKLQRRALEEDMWRRFFEFSHKVNQLDIADEGRISALKREIEAANRWPSGGKEIIEQKLRSKLADAKGIASQTQSEQSALEKVRQKQDDRERALRLVCIRAEILAGIESPQEDKALRMEYQVKMIQKGLGTAAIDESNAGDLARDWATIGSIDDSVYRKLWERFDACWKIINKT